MPFPANLFSICRSIEATFHSLPVLESRKQTYPCPFKAICLNQVFVIWKVVGHLHNRRAIKTFHEQTCGVVG